MEVNELMEKLANNRGVVWGMTTQRKINSKLNTFDEIEKIVLEAENNKVECRSDAYDEIREIIEKRI